MKFLHEGANSECNRASSLSRVDMVPVALNPKP